MIIDKAIRHLGFRYGFWPSALPPLGFSPKILGYSIESWVLGFLSEGLGFFLGFLKGPSTLFFGEKWSGNQRRWLRKKVIRKFWRRKTFSQEKFAFFRKSAIFSRNVPKTYRNLTLGFLGFFIAQSWVFNFFWVATLVSIRTYDVLPENIWAMLLGWNIYSRCCSAEIYTCNAVLLEYIIMCDAVLLE